MIDLLAVAKKRLVLVTQIGLVFVTQIRLVLKFIDFLPQDTYLTLQRKQCHANLKNSHLSQLSRQKLNLSFWALLHGKNLVWRMPAFAVRNDVNAANPIGVKVAIKLARKNTIKNWAKQVKIKHRFIQTLLEVQKLTLKHYRDFKTNEDLSKKRLEKFPFINSLAWRVWKKNSLMTTWKRAVFKVFSGFFSAGPQSISFSLRIYYNCTFYYFAIFAIEMNGFWNGNL